MTRIFEYISLPVPSTAITSFGLCQFALNSNLVVRKNNFQNVISQTATKPMASSLTLELLLFYSIISYEYWSAVQQFLNISKKISTRN